MARKFCSMYDHPTRVVVVNDEPSLTLQQAANECDINKIVERYAKTGSWTSDGSSPRGPAPSFGDFTDVSDFLTAQNAVIDAQEAFDALPSRVRRQFDNDPASLLEFLANPSNRDQAIELGLVSAPQPAVDGASGDSKPPSAQLPT